MYLNDYQTAARKTAIGLSLDHFVHGLTEEAGEVAGILKRFHRGDADYAPHTNPKTYKVSINPYMRDKLRKELGDVLWYVAMIADLIETPLADVAKGNIAKLLARQQANTITGSGDDR